MRPQEQLEQYTVRDALQCYGDEVLHALAMRWNCSLGTVRLRADASLLPIEKDWIASIFERRKSGEPLQYILGRWDFYGRSFFVDSRALIPRPETEELVERVLHAARAFYTRRGQAEDDKKNIRILDIGTGSGAIAITLALECDFVQIYALDLSEDALALAKKNAELWHLGESSIHFIFSDLFPTQPIQFDIIVSNPPYIDPNTQSAWQQELHFEPRMALTAEENGFALIRKIIENSPFYLKSGGMLFLEIGYDQGHLVQKTLEARGFSAVQVDRDWNGHIRYAQAQWDGEHDV